MNINPYLIKANYFIYFVSICHAKFCPFNIYVHTIQQEERTVQSHSLYYVDNFLTKSWNPTDQLHQSLDVDF